MEYMWVPVLTVLFCWDDYGKKIIHVHVLWVCFLIHLKIKDPSKQFHLILKWHVTIYDGGHLGDIRIRELALDDFLMAAL